MNRPDPTRGIRLSYEQEAKLALTNVSKEAEYLINKISEIRGLGHVNTPVRYDAYLVGVATAGNAAAKVNGRQYRVDKTNVFYIGPSSLLEITDMSDDFEGVMFNCTTALTARTGFHFSERIWDLFSVDSNALVTVTDEQRDTLLFLLNRLKELIIGRHLPLYDEMTRNYFMAFLYELSDIYRSNYGVDVKNLTKKESLVAGFLSHVPRYCREMRGLDFYAGQLHVTSKYLSKVVKELTGQTAGGMIDEAIMLEAKLMLSDPELSLNQVAEALRFGDQSIFGKFFKKYAGVAPSEYRLAI
jgi:AraC family transcriptional activator of pobA